MAAFYRMEYRQQTPSDREWTLRTKVRIPLVSKEMEDRATSDPSYAKYLLRVRVARTSYAAYISLSETKNAEEAYVVMMESVEAMKMGAVTCLKEHGIDPSFGMVDLGSDVDEVNEALGNSERRRWTTAHLRQMELSQAHTNLYNMVSARRREMELLRADKNSTEEDREKCESALEYLEQRFLDIDKELAMEIDTVREMQWIECQRLSHRKQLLDSIRACKSPRSDL